MAVDRTTIGQMREQIQIVTASSAPFGEFSIENEFTLKFNARARVRNLNEVSLKRNIGMDIGQYTHTFIIRASTNRKVDNNDMIIWKHDLYAIIGLEYIARNTVDPKKRFIRIYGAFSRNEVAFQNPAPEQ